MNKPMKVLTALALTASLTVTTIGSASAQSNRVMWGKTELKVGQIGKVTILKDTPLYSIVDGSTLTSKRTLKKGDEFRVYQYKNQNGGLYGVGGGGFIMKDLNVKYETPSKSKLKLIADFIPVVTPPNKENKGYVYTGKEADMVGKTNVSTEKIKNVIPDGYALLGFDGRAIVKNGKDSILNYSYDTDEYVKEKYYPNSYFYNNTIGFSTYDIDTKGWTTQLNIIHATMTELGLQVSKSDLKNKINSSYNGEQGRLKIGDALLVNWGNSMIIIWNDK